MGLYFIDNGRVWYMAMVLLALTFFRKQRSFIFLNCLAILFFLITACSNNVEAPVNNSWNNISSTQTRHKVQPGETLYSIAWRFNISDADLARWNYLHKPYNLRIGQVIRLAPPAHEKVLKKIPVIPLPLERQSMPVQSTVNLNANKAPIVKALPIKPKLEAVTQLNPPSSASNNWAWPATGPLLATYGQDGNKGIDIGLPIGMKVNAVQDGLVVYAGANLHGYGQLIIIKQKADLMTAYAHNSKLLAAEGDKVIAGQNIALSGNTEASQPMLHFEVRKAGKPVDPMQYLSKH